MEKIFLAFWWRKDQNLGIEKISQKENLILLNLELFTLEELNEYLIDQKIALPYPHIPTIIEYDKNTIPSWGIIYEFEDESYYSFIFLLELYLNNFLSPLFQFYIWWFERLSYNHYLDTFSDGYLPDINIDNLSNFLNNYKWIIDYSYWLRPRVFDWVKGNDDEAFRLFSALWLYKSLKEYSKWKSMFFWQKEVMEIWIILETLFTESNEKESIWYALKKRIHLLSLDLIDDIEKEIKWIYGKRSDFVHWASFRRLRKQYEIEWDDIKENFDEKIFEITKSHITILRKILLLYFRLHKGIADWEFNWYFPSWKKLSCIDVIELSAFEKDVRNKLLEEKDLLNSIIDY